MKKIITTCCGALALSILAGPVNAGSCCPTPATAPATAKPAGAPAAIEFTAPLPAVLEAYTQIQNGLASDSLTGLAPAAKTLAKLLIEDPAKTLPAGIAPAQAIAEAKTIEAARTAFKELSDVLTRFLAQAKVRPGQYQIVYCEMAKAHWLQGDKAIKNPYYGKSMLTCGRIIGSF
jgi:Cu(I)/Ag(I) efflux system membrane fusion protein